MSERKVKLIIIGDSSVGKTCILNRYIKNGYDDKKGATVGADIITKKVNVNSQEITALIWDTAGQEKYQSVTASFYRNTDGGMIVFDITSSDSFKNVETWARSYYENNDKSQVFIIVGNKSDLSSERKVSKQEAEELAKKYNTEYFEVSAKDGSYVNDAFENLLTLSIENYQEANISQLTTLNIENSMKNGKQNDSPCNC